MPSINKHCYYSEKRTGNSYRRLHEWMDKPREVLGVDHRSVRHDTSYIPEVKEKFGKEAVPEFLQHISSDYESTARKCGLKRIKNK